jgi:hypothetical protein
MLCLRRRAISATAAASLALSIAMTWASPARAYRPFDGTDADVADLGNFELELGPASLYYAGTGHFLEAPATVLNLGFARGWEAVIDFQNFVALDPTPSEPRLRLLETDALLKALIVPGSLQEAGPGPSAAVEFGPLLPEVNGDSGDSGVGASCNVVVSQRWSGLVIHANNWIQLTRGTRHLDWFEGMIFEGSLENAFRPVGEVFVEHEWVAGVTTWSGLVGGIWRARSGLDLDVGLREARVAGQGITEVRFGLTWTIGVWRPEEPAGHGATPHRQLPL